MTSIYSLIWTMEDNDGFAATARRKTDALKNMQTTLSSLHGFGSLDYINKDFRTIERLYNIEFVRDWNLIDPMGDQRFVNCRDGSSRNPV